jgi:chemotaxis protein MotB
MADKDLAPIVIKKIKKGGHGHHGGAWKLAYADFVTAMMAFFLVMWILGMDFHTKNGLAEYFQNPGSFRVDFKSSPYMMKLDGKPPSWNDKVEAAARTKHNISYEDAESLLSLLKSAIRNESRVRDLARRVDMTITGQGLKIEFGETAGGAFFEPGTANLITTSKRMFQAIAPVLIGSKKSITIEGHTDSQPLTDLNYTKWELGADRANAVRRALYAVGVPQDRIVGVMSKADRELKRLDTPQAIENNRVIIMIPTEAD